MLFRCEHCNREVESSEPQILPQGIAMVCPSCGAINWLSKNAEAKPSPAPVPAQPTEQKRKIEEPQPAPTPQKPEPYEEPLPPPEAPAAVQTDAPKVSGGFVFVDNSAAPDDTGKSIKKPQSPSIATKPALPHSLQNPGIQSAVKKAKATWANLITGNYEEQAEHKKFMQFCSSNDILDFAAYCYRNKMYEEGEDPVSKWAVDHIIGLATVKYLTPVNPEENKLPISPTFKKILWVLLVAFMGLTVYAIFSMIAQFDKSPFSGF